MLYKTVWNKSITRGYAEFSKYAWKTQTLINILYATKIFLLNFDVYSGFFLFLRTVKLYLRTLKGISELRVYDPD